MPKQNSPATFTTLYTVKRSGRDPLFIKHMFEEKTLDNTLQELGDFLQLCGYKIDGRLTVIQEE